MTAGESKTITVEWDFSDPNVPKDWSLVAWAKDGDITLTHDGGDVTDVLPVI